MPLPDALRGELLRLARASIRHGLAAGGPPHIDLDRLPAALREVRATFVTLLLRGELRGCIGTLEPRLPLAADVSGNAYRAAFSDPRFPPVTPWEEPGLDIHVSILSIPEPLAASSQADLIARLRPGVDGLIIEEGSRRATFLPSVWEQLPDPRDFLAHLMRKAGLSAGHWSPTLRVERYRTESFGEEGGGFRPGTGAGEG